MQAALAQALSDPRVRSAIEASGPAAADPVDLEQAKTQYEHETAQFRKIVADRAISVN